MQNDSIAQYFDQLLDKQDRTVQIVFFNIRSVAKKLNIKPGKLTADEIDHAICTTDFVKKHGFWLVAKVELGVYALIRMAPPSEYRGLIPVIEALVDQRLACIDEVHKPDSKLAGWSRFGL